MNIDSIVYPGEKRPLIPSSEEAGEEADSLMVKDGPVVAAYPRNPVIRRGQDPELFWMGKYGTDDEQDVTRIDIRSLYRHEHIQPDKLISRLYHAKTMADNQLDMSDMFANLREMDEIEKIEGWYTWPDNWKNRLIQGDSLLVMTSLLESEGMAGKVQCIYIDPPYGIKYGSNWQMRLNNRAVKDGDDADLSGEPEQIKAYRDTWELAIHSYLSYLRDRLLVAKELLSESGSVFVQISDENMHHVRELMDEVFGSDNFVNMICFLKTSGQTSGFISSTTDYLLWYAKDKLKAKYNKLYQERSNSSSNERYDMLENPDGTIRRLATTETQYTDAQLGGRRFRPMRLDSQGAGSDSTSEPYTYNGKTFHPLKGRHWSVATKFFDHIKSTGRFIASGETLEWKKYFADFPLVERTNIWLDTMLGAGKKYTVQTGATVIQRCILMTTDPGDLVLDPTCGSGTTANVAEQWGRRWITIDTSRIAINIAKTRVMREAFPYYKLYDEQRRDIRLGFIYKKVPHVTLKSIAKDEAPEIITLYDQPYVEGKRLRVAGPFTVETLQSFEPVVPEMLDAPVPEAGEVEQFETTIFQHLKSAGVRNGVRQEQAIFTRVERLPHAYLHAEGFYQAADGERKSYFHIGPKFGTVSKLAVNEAIKECRRRGDAEWLIILGFQFEDTIETQPVTTSMGSFMVTKTRMGDDLMQDGLLKKDKKAASFVTIGEPDIRLHREGENVIVEICGLDIYDPIKDEVKPRNVADIAYWTVDDDYDGSNFIVHQVFFCGGDHDEFDKWRRGLSNLVVNSARRNMEKTLKIELDEDAFARLYSFRSHPIQVIHAGQKIAVRVISQFGEECTKVLEV